MSYGTGGSDGKSLTFFKIMNYKKSDPEPFFEGRKSVGGNYEPIEEKPTWLSGTLTKVETSSFEWEGTTYHKVKLELSGADSKEVLEIGYSTIGISIINTLLGSGEFMDVKIELWKGNNGWPNVKTIVDGDEKKSNWKFDYNKEIKPLIESVTLAGKTITDKSKLVTFLEKEIKARFDGLESIVPSVDVPDSGQTFETTTKVEDEPSDDLPF